MAKKQNEEPKTEAAATVPVGEQALMLPPDMASLLIQDAQEKQAIATEDLAIPRIILLQQGSPQVQRGDAAYIDGLDPGDLYEQVNGTIWKGEAGFEGIVCGYRKAFHEFIPRTKGGGWQGERSSSAVAQTQTDPDTGNMVFPNGNELVETFEYFVLILDEHQVPTQAVISMAKSQRRVGKKLNSLIQGLVVPSPEGNGKYISPPMFYSTYKFTTGPVKNKKGQSWFMWDVVPGRPVLGIPERGRDLYLAARTLHTNVREDKVRVATPQAENNNEGSEVPF